MVKVGIVIAAGLMVAPASWAQTQGELARTCATSDLRAINVIEEQGPRVSGSAVDAAFGALVKARGACADGRHVEGLALYDTITLMSDKAAPAATATR